MKTKCFNFLALIFLIAFSVTGCSYKTTITRKETGPQKYILPQNTDFTKEKMFSASFDNIWEGIISYFATNNISIKTLEKDSGIIVAERMVDFSSDIDLLFDIGHIEEEISQHSETYKCNQWYMLKSQSIDPQFYPIVKQVCKKLDSEQKDTYINRIKIKSDIITTYNVFARKAKNGINVSVNTTFNPLNSSSDFKYRAVSLGLIENSILRYIDDYLNKK